MSSGFAVDHVQQQTMLEAGASFELRFGPPTPGSVDVMIYARSAVLPFGAAPPPPAPPAPRPPAPPLVTGGPGGLPVSPIAPAPIDGLTRPRRDATAPQPLRAPGIGARAGLGDDVARARIDPLRPGLGGIGGGVLEPGDVLPPLPPVPPVVTLDQALFRVELIDAQGTVRLAGQGRTQGELSEAATGAGASRGLRDDVLGDLLGGGSRWTLRITHTGTVRAQLTINLLFHGRRPILTREIDLEFLNEKLDLLFNVPQPFQIAFRNREVARVRVGGAEVPVIHTVVRLEASPAWRELYPELSELEKDLGARVFTEETASYEIRVRASLHDGALAFKASIAFPSFVGRIDVLNVIDALGHDVVAGIGRAIVDLTPVDRPTISIDNFAFDVFLVLRPGGVFMQPGPMFEVVTRPRIVLRPGWANTVVEALMQVAFERLLPAAAAGPFRAKAASLLGWLLGERDREVVGSTQQLSLQYAGDPPAPPVLTADPIGSGGSGPLDPGTLAKIDHIVVVMLENRSFDHMLGFLSLPATGNDGRNGLGRADVDGLRGDETNPGDTRGARHRVVSLATPRAPTPGLDPAHETRGTKFRHDPGHSYEATDAQRGGYDIVLPPLPIGGRRFDPDLDPDADPPAPRVFRVGANQGFVLDFARKLSGRVSAFEEQLLRGEVMGYHPAAHVPTYRFLAEQYALCDRWFAAHPGHTWPNRFVSLTGRLNVGADGLPQVNNPPMSSFDPLETATLFDHLTAGGVDWRYFEHDFCMLRLFSKYTFDTQRVRRIDDPNEGFFALAARGALPPVTWIEPDLTDIPPGNDDHPPADITAGQAFIQRIHDALADGPAWPKTLLLVTYDEHGGFYDHVHPASRTVFDARAPDPAAFAPIGLDPATRRPIDHYGFRVPAFVVSPWVPAASVGHDDYDHTSLIKTVLARFLPARPPDMGLRVALARDVGSLLSLDAPRARLRAPRVDVAIDGLEAVALHRASPDDDFRAFMVGMRTRLRGAGVVDRSAVIRVLRR